MLSESGRARIRPIPRSDDPVIAEVLRRMVAAYQPERIYLFGSTARGDSGPDSDYDILVVVPDTAAPERQDERLAYEALVGTGIAVDVLVYKAADFYGRLPLKASLPSTVAREGRLLYASLRIFASETPKSGWLDPPKISATLSMT